MEINLLPPQEWGLFPESRPWVIAGPCSAESYRQVLDTALSVKRAGVSLFRAGIWKPRTRPGSFEGVGAKGLEWLRQVRDVTGMKIATEVALASHVEQCLEAGVDVLWLGARTTANPFLVQQIADALDGADVAVLVKNPVSPDADLWAGAFERLFSAGVRRLAAVHRGVSSYCNGKYRNDPAWNLAIELRRRIPDVPLFCDPSHMGGRKEFVPELSRRSMELGFDGLMIEVHSNPSQALSDAAQQIDPSELESLLHDGGIAARDVDSCDGSYRLNIERLRAVIDVLDDDILNLIAKRMEVSAEIGRLKGANNVAVLQPSRWTDVLDRMIREGSAKGLSSECVKAVFSAVHEESVAVQNNSGNVSIHGDDNENS